MDQDERSAEPGPQRRQRDSGRSGQHNDAPLVAGAPAGRGKRPWRSLTALVIALVAGVVSANTAQGFGSYLSAGHAISKIVSAGCAAIFLAAGVTAAFGLAESSRSTLHPRVGEAHAAVVRYAALLAGLIATLVITLELFKVPIGQLVVGGVLTSVLLGIAAQQSLSNLFAGLVLLLSRPFRVGDHIRLRAGTLGGQLDGIVTEIGITYVRLDVGDTIMAVPNSQVLAAAVGPVPAQPGTAPPAATSPRPRRDG